MRRIAWMLNEATAEELDEAAALPALALGGARTSPSGRSPCGGGAPSRPSQSSESSPHQPGSISASRLSSLGAPKASTSAPSGPPSRQRAARRRHPHGLERAELDDLVLDAQARAAREDDVDLLLLLVAVAEGGPEVGREAEVADAGALQASGSRANRDSSPGERSNRGAMSSTSRRLTLVKSLISVSRFARSSAHASRMHYMHFDIIIPWRTCRSAGCRRTSTAA